MQAVDIQAVLNKTTLPDILLPLTGGRTATDSTVML